MLDFDLDTIDGRVPIVQFVPISYFDVVSALEGGFTSAIGHADTAAVVGNILDLPVQANRVSVKLEQGDNLIVAQYSGPRLPEGSTSLPEGASIKFVCCNVKYL